MYIFFSSRSIAAVGFVWSRLALLETLGFRFCGPGKVAAFGVKQKKNLIIEVGGYEVVNGGSSSPNSVSNVVDGVVLTGH